MICPSFHSVLQGQLAPRRTTPQQWDDDTNGIRTREISEEEAQLDVQVHELLFGPKAMYYLITLGLRADNRLTLGLVWKLEFPAGAVLTLVGTQNPDGVVPRSGTHTRVIDAKKRAGRMAGDRWKLVGVTIPRGELAGDPGASSRGMPPAPHIVNIFFMELHIVNMDGAYLKSNKIGAWGYIVRSSEQLFWQVQVGIIH